MNHDPIVEDVREVREKLYAKFDNDLGKYVEHLAAEQSKERDRLVAKDEVLRRKQRK
jgi:hypothetical protein